MEMSLLPPAPPVPLANRPRQGVIRWALQRIGEYARGVEAPPAGNTEQALYGLAQPILGARVLLADSELLKEALYPAAMLAGACALYASFGTETHGHWGWLKSFYKAFAALAPLPSFFFANHYARLCDKLALDSRGEIALMESNRAVSVGFSLSTAALLATPVLNLLFRPIIIAGSSHLLAQIEKDEEERLLPPSRTVSSAG